MAATLPTYSDEHAFVNVKNPVYAVLQTESATSAENVYDEIKAISPAMSIKISSDTNTETLYGDGEPKDIATTKGETSLEIGVNTVSVDFLAESQGHTCENGVMIEKGSDVAPYVAVGFIIEKSNGKRRAYWLLKGKIEDPDVDADQKEDKISFSTPTVKGSFVTRKDGHRLVVFDEEDPDAAKAPWTSVEEFLSTVPTTVTTAKASGAKPAV